jgi:hypothetical protein
VGMKKEDIVTFNQSDKNYSIILKEQVGDFVKISFQYEEAIWFGIILTMSSSGNITVKVKGKVNEDDEANIF